MGRVSIRGASCALATEPMPMATADRRPATPRPDSLQLLFDARWIHGDSVGSPAAAWQAVETVEEPASCRSPAAALFDKTPPWHTVLARSGLRRAPPEGQDPALGRPTGGECAGPIGGAAYPPTCGTKCLQA